MTNSNRTLLNMFYWVPLLVFCNSLFIVVVDSFTSDSNCHHIDHNYAFKYTEDLVRLGESGGLIVITEKNVAHCLRDIDGHELMPHGFDSSEEHSERDQCRAIGKFMIESIEGKQIRFLVVINQTVYYGSVADTILHSFQLPDKLSTGFNYRFAMPQIGQWVDKNLESYQLEAAEFVQTSESTPRYPSLLKALEDNKQARLLMYVHTDPDDGTNSQENAVGTTTQKVRALYMQNRQYRDKVKAIVFFDNYYGQVSLNLAQTSYDVLNVFPILPVQSIFGCGVHLCWWPLLNDVLYYKNTFYFFQGERMFRMVEGADKAKQLNMDNAYFLPDHEIKFNIHGAYVDYAVSEQGSVMLIRKKKSEFILVDLKIDESGNGNLKLGYERIELEIAETGGIQILGATMMKEEKKLWVVVRKEEELNLRGFKYDSKHSAYLWDSQEPMPFTTISGIFYHPNQDILYLISGFFLYAYEKPLERMDSRCSVTHFGTFFNCTTDYYTEFKSDVFQSREEYYARARAQFTDEELLPRKCNWMSDNMTNGAIHFTDKIVTEPVEESWFHWEHICMGLAMVAGVALTIGLFYGCSVLSRRRKGQGKSTVERRNRERKLKEFLNQRLAGGTTTRGRGNSTTKKKNQSPTSSAKSLSSKSPESTQSQTEDGTKSNRKQHKVSPRAVTNAKPKKNRR